MLTDNEIIKALECCVECDTYCDECSEDCPLKETNDCTYALRRNSLDLINRQKAENLNLTSCLTSLQNDLTSARAEIERLLQKLQQAQSEAYKAFAELVNNRLFKGEKFAYEREYIKNLAKKLSEVSDNA